MFLFLLICNFCTFISYVHNLEKGFELIWSNFISGKKPKTVHVIADKISTVPKIYAQNSAENIYLKLNTTVNFFPKYSYNFYEKKIPALNRTQQLTLSDLNKLHEKTLGEIEKYVRDHNTTSSTSTPQSSSLYHAKISIDQGVEVTPTTSAKAAATARARARAAARSANEFREEWKRQHKGFYNPEEEVKKKIEKQRENHRETVQEKKEKFEKLRSEYEHFPNPKIEEKEKKEEKVVKKTEEVCTNPLHIITMCGGP